jgi:wyosine [tRNA(Phe)-imidazoG37] synthetase (radical SAM superfamily)
MDIIETLLKDTKETLITILLYNYGEPFLDKRLLEIMRLAKRLVPDVYIGISTNGTVLPADWSESIVKEQLVSGIKFSIDGASQETYGRYRVGGSFEKAFKNMVILNDYNKMYKETNLLIYWQYILFEWNDSDQEIQKAIDLAVEHGLTIQWTLTATAGKSKRYTPGSSDFERLQGGKHLCYELHIKHDAAQE